MKSSIYSTQLINQNFLIKVYGVDPAGKKINKLVGVAGAVDLIGADLFYKFVGRAFDCADDVCVCKLRRGVKFSFYAK